MYYLDYFLKFLCAPDILMTTSSGGRSAKEISEAISIHQRLKRELLSNPMKLNVLELCAGCALTSLLSVYVGGAKYAIAIDKEERNGKWERAKRFTYLKKNIFEDEKEIFEMINKDTIIVGVHPCTNLAIQCIKFFNESKARSLYLMPCCSQKMNLKHAWLRKYTGTYRIWALELAEMCSGHVNVVEDFKNLSPRNVIIMATRQNERVNNAKT